MTSYFYKYTTDSSISALHKSAHEAGVHLPSVFFFFLPLLFCRYLHDEFLFYLKEMSHPLSHSSYKATCGIQQEWPAHESPLRVLHPKAGDSKAAFPLSLQRKYDHLYRQSQSLWLFPNSNLQNSKYVVQCFNTTMGKNLIFTIISKDKQNRYFLDQQFLIALLLSLNVWYDNNYPQLNNVLLYSTENHLTTTKDAHDAGK